MKGSEIQCRISPVLVLVPGLTSSKLPNLAKTLFAYWKIGKALPSPQGIKTNDTIEVKAGHTT